jgi:hypothetical protein
MDSLTYVTSNCLWFFFTQLYIFAVRINKEMEWHCRGLWLVDDCAGLKTLR